MLQKICGGAPEAEKRYSPAECAGCERRIPTGEPEKKHISTSFAERDDFTMQMHMRSVTRLTNASPKKAESYAHAVALHPMLYNFFKLHKANRFTPAMAAGVADRFCEAADIVKMLEE